MEKYSGYYQQYQKKNQSMIQMAYYTSLEQAFNYDKINNAKDVYVSVNKHKKAKGRNEDTVKQLTTILIDLDPINETKKSDRKILKEILKDLSDNDLIKASYYNFSGSGCQIIFETKGDSLDIAFVYENVSIVFGEHYQRLINQELKNRNSDMRLKYDSASSRNKSGLMRLGGINTKTNEQVIINKCNLEKRSIQDLELIIENLNIVSVDRSIARPILNEKTQDILTQRLDFLQSQNFEKGKRDLILFHMYNVAKQLFGNEIGEAIMRAKNTSIKDLQLSEKELKQITRYLNKKGYLKYKNETFYLSFDVDVPLSKKDAQRLIKRTQKKYNQDLAISMLQDKIPRKEIMRKTGYSARQLVRLNKSIKES